jgi:hypothetical protein
MRQGQGLGQLNSKNISHISSLSQRTLDMERRVRREKKRFYFGPRPNCCCQKYRQTQLMECLSWRAQPKEKMLPHAHSHISSDWKGRLWTAFHRVQRQIIFPIRAPRNSLVEQNLLVGRRLKLNYAGECTR